jgi:hypothetical protein
MCDVASDGGASDAEGSFEDGMNGTKISNNKID